MFISNDIFQPDKSSLFHDEVHRWLSVSTVWFQSLQDILQKCFTIKQRVENGF